ncbi:MAG: hypothetical protein KUG51_03995 [Urechidicola sp.]|nr:hypothetical protein [Urechidicola sp.]
MKNLSWGNKLIFLINSLVAIALLLTNLLPYISPKSAPSLSVFSLSVPVLIVLNVLFVVYWSIKLKKQFLLSAIILLIGFQQVSSFFKLSNKEVFLNDDLKIMSYNVRLFNIYKWKKEGRNETLKPITDFITEKKPDVICFQEFLTDYDVTFDYKYNYIKKNNTKGIEYFGMAIYSNYKIINKGSIDFENSANNTIFVDVLKGNDTIRIYNTHLELSLIHI